jgi:hypothetical protein
VHGPILPARFGELTGAVERVDDPHPRGPQPRRVVNPLLRQHSVIRVPRRQLLDQEVVRTLVSDRLPLGLRRIGELVTHTAQQLTGPGGQPGSQLVVTH